MSRRFMPTDAERAQVRKMAGHGLTHAMIARLIRDGISVKTLLRCFPHELEWGRANATAKLAECLYERALAGCVVSTLFWLKCRANWREVNRTEFTGPDGEPLARATGVLIVPATMDAAQWEREVAVAQARLMVTGGKPPSVQ
jgi:hypothetical protein